LNLKVLNILFSETRNVACRDRFFRLYPRTFSPPLNRGVGTIESFSRILGRKQLLNFVRSGKSALSSSSSRQRKPCAEWLFDLPVWTAELQIGSSLALALLRPLTFS